MKLFSWIQRFWGDMPLGGKFAAFYILLVILILPLTWMNIQRVRAALGRELQDQAELLLFTAGSSLRRVVMDDDVNQIGHIAEEYAENPLFTRFRVYDDEGVLLADFREPSYIKTGRVDPQSAPFVALDPSEIYTDWAGPGQDELVAGRAMWVGTDRIGALEIGLSTELLNDKMREVTWRSSGLALAMLLVGGLLSLLMARQITNPISELIKTSDKMAGGDLEARSEHQSRDEIGQLSLAFNEMAGAIEQRDTELRDLAGGLERMVAARTNELEQKNQYLAALNRVTHGLNENLEVDRSLERIMVAAAGLAETEHAFVNVFDPERGEMERRVAQGRYQAHLGTWTKPNQGLSGRVLATGEMIIASDYQEFEDRQADYDWLRTSIYVPLRFGQDVLGVIGLGYDKVVDANQDRLDILNQFAQLASLALKNAQLYSETREGLTEAQQALLAEEERRRVHRATPQGRAEALAESLARNPAPGLVALHELAGKAEHDSNAAVLAELPGALEAAGQTRLARLAQGYDFILRSHSEPGLLAVGLKELRGGLDADEAGSVEFAEEASRLYSICLQAIGAASIQPITNLRPSLTAVSSSLENPSPFGEFANTLRALLPAAESLHAYERVDTIDDRRIYLGNASDGLRAADRLAHSLPAADRPIVLRIIETWGAIVAGSLSELQTRAQISYRLITQRSWGGETVTLALALRNDGQGTALNVRVSLAESPDYTALDDAAAVERLGRGDEALVELRVHPQLAPRTKEFRAQFAILFDDPRGPGQAESFADLVRLMTPAETFRLIPNPYVSGKPLESGSPLFFGREDVFSFISENLNAGHRNNLVLIGQRRTGKSSVLKQLPLRLDPSFVPVYLDGQSIAIDPGLPAFFANLAAQISYELHDRGFDIASPEIGEFRERPAHVFEYDYLRRVRATLGERHVVLMLDEFEELESAARRGSLDTSVFGFLRHVIQHGRRLSVIFCGTHRIEELAADYFGVLFNISLYKHIGSLEQAEAFRLIQEPVAPHDLSYDDLALHKIWLITSGHPYFLQLLCRSVVRQVNRTRRGYVTVSDIDAALEDMFAEGEAHFVYLWNDSSLAERQVLTALSRIMPMAGRVTPVQVEDYLADRGLSLGRPIIAQALHHLTLRDILTMQVDSQAAGVSGIYSWRLGLLGLWIAKYRSLSLVQEEAR